MEGAYGIGVKSIEQGAATSVWCAVSSQLSGKGGVYYADCDIAELVSDDSQLQSGVRRWAIDKPTAKASEWKANWSKVAEMTFRAQ